MSLLISYNDSPTKARLKLLYLMPFAIVMLPLSVIVIGFNEVVPDFCRSIWSVIKTGRP